MRRSELRLVRLNVLESCRFHVRVLLCGVRRALSVIAVFPLSSASAEPTDCAPCRACWCAPSADVTGLTSSVPSSPGYIEIIHTSTMREKFYVEILTNGIPTAEFQVIQEPYQYIDLSFKQPGMLSGFAPQLFSRFLNNLRGYYTSR